MEENGQKMSAEENNNQNSNPESATEENNTEAQPTAADDMAVKYDELQKQYLYLKAEFDTFKRNAIKERADLLKYGSERFLVDVLGVLDIFDKAMATEVTADSLTSYVQGIEMTASEMKKVLDKNGVSEIDPVKEPFDPTNHEALSSLPTTDVEAGHVVSVFRKGYKLHDKLIRTAQVVVAQEPSS